ncbi:helix-turn-helix domain-containing protein [Pseudomonas luteola]
MNTENALGLLIRRYRTERRLKLKDLANHLNISSAYLSSIENNKKLASKQFISDLAIVLQIDNDPKAMAELDEAVQLSQGFVRINLKGASREKAQFAIELARLLPSLDSKSIQVMCSLLRYTPAAKHQEANN